MKKARLSMNVVVAAVLVGFSPVALAGGDIEPNNFHAQASQLQAIDQVNYGYLQLGDIDVYKIAPATTSGWRTITVYPSSGVYPMVTLQDSVGNWIIGSNVPPGSLWQPVSVRFYAPAGQPYYLVVQKDEFRSVSSGNYDLYMRWN